MTRGHTPGEDGRLFWFVIIFACFCCLGRSASVANIRTWDASDGLVEGNSMKTYLQADGTLWVKHGLTTEMSIMDGFTARRIPDPKVLHLAYGEWAGEGEGIKHYRDGVWTLFPCKENVLDLTPIDGDHAFVLTSSALYVFSLKTKTYEEKKRASDTKIGNFTNMAQYRADRVLWIAGEEGAAQLTFDSVNAPLNSIEFTREQIGLKKLVAPMAGYRGEFLIAGISLQTGKPAVARFNEKHFDIIFEGETASLKTWPGLNNATWILEGLNLYAVNKNRKEVIHLPKSLGTRVSHVTPEPSGSFWLSFGQMLVRFGVPLWDAPVGPAQIESRVHSIMEEPQGTLWIGTTQYLLRYADGKSTRFFLPDKEPFWDLCPTSLCSLPDGRILTVKEKNHLVGGTVFDPRDGSFSPLRHPQGRVLGFFEKQSDGTLLFQTFDPKFATTPIDASTAFHIESYQDGKFTLVADLGGKWKFADPEVRSL